MPVLQWSPIVDPDDWIAFEELIGDEVAARGWTVDLAEGWACDGDVQFGLFNVAGKCRRVQRAQELLAPALRQAREQPGLELKRYELHGAPLYVLTGESFFTATHASWADRFYEPAAVLGTLVGVSTRHIVVAHPIRDRSAPTVIAQMLQLVARYFNDGPGSLSVGLYWLLDGRMERLETWIDEQGPHLSRSPRFTPVLKALTA